MRWAFLFLLLVNAIVLFWYAVTTAERTADVSVSSEAHKIKLLNEVDLVLLAQQRNSGDFQSGEKEGGVVGSTEAQSSESLKLSPVVTECVRIGEVLSQLTAERLVDFLSERGFDAFIDQVQHQQVVGYRVEMQSPDGDGARIQLLDRLAQASIVPESRMDNGRLVFVLRRFDRYEDAEAFAGVLRVLDLLPELRPIEEPTYTYFVRYQLGSDHKISSKINVIVKKAYPDLKIEKKRCEGVASLGGDR